MVCSVRRQNTGHKSKQATSMGLVARTKHFIARDLYAGAKKQTGVLVRTFEVLKVFSLIPKRNCRRVTQCFGWSSISSGNDAWELLQDPSGGLPSSWHAEEGARSCPVGVGGRTSPGAQIFLSLQHFYLTEQSGSTSRFFKLPWGIQLIFYASLITEFTLQIWKQS